MATTFLAFGWNGQTCGRSEGDVTYPGDKLADLFGSPGIPGPLRWEGVDDSPILIREAMA
jgi:hypothetical protein